MHRKQILIKVFKHYILIGSIFSIYSRPSNSKVCVCVCNYKASELSSTVATHSPNETQGCDTLSLSLNLLSFKAGSHGILWLGKFPTSSPME